MRYLIRIIISLVMASFMLPAKAATPPFRDMYLRSRERSRHGSEVRQVESAVSFLWNNRKIGVMNESASDDFLLNQLACSIRRALPEARGAEFLQAIADLIAREAGRSDDASDILILLTHLRLCEPPRALQDAVKPLSIIHLDRDGAVVSLNPVWNACVRGKGITAALIKSNADRTLHRSGHLRTEIPWSCRDYHKGPIDFWTHPDFPDLSIVLDDHGRLMSALPVGFLAVKGSSIVEASSY